MDGMLYPISIVLLALFAFTFYKSNNTILAMILVAIGAYIIYSQETGYTATDFRHEMVDTAKEAAHGHKKDLSTERMK